ncbi:hypothetical protein [Azospirillum griseum]|uniref:Uncharacterized protein n=1 Tax=Azospirillum griseum TaxID=2496639 RepID=A0A3S0KW82_9PROT|nr:hypothetical protein [Azospirillum griseum]RTR17255.1 hypothetical protein EJ903_18745 [Azospirillum griseum]
MTSTVATGFVPGSQILLQSLSAGTSLQSILIAQPTTGALTMASSTSGTGNGGSWLVADAGQSVTYNGQTIAGIYLISLSTHMGARFLNGDTTTALVSLAAAPSTGTPAVWYPVPTVMGGYCLACSPGPAATTSVWLTNNNNPGPGPNLSLYSICNQGSGVTDSWWQPVPLTFGASL